MAGGEIGEGEMPELPAEKPAKSEKSEKPVKPEMAEMPVKPDMPIRAQLANC